MFKFIKLIRQAFLLKRIEKRMLQQKALSEKFIAQFTEINKAFDLKDRQFNLELKRLSEFRKKTNNLSASEKVEKYDEIVKELNTIHSPFSPGHETYIDELQKSMDDTIVHLKSNYGELTKLKEKL